jgi:hypothetical protein
MTGYFIESLIMSVAIQFNFQLFSTNAYQFTTFPAPSFSHEGKQKGSVLTFDTRSEGRASRQQ